MSFINNLVYNSVKKPEKLNILSFFFNGTFDIELLKTGHNFYGCLDNSAYAWPGFKDRNFPNLKFINNMQEIINHGLDLIVFNSRQHNEQFFNFTRQLHVPGIIVDHNYIQTNSFFIKKHIEACKIKSISTNPQCEKQFQSEENINYNIEDISGEFDKDIDILIVGTFGQENFPWLFQLKQMFPTLKLVGHNPEIPFSELVETYKDYKNLFRRAKVFVNLPLQANISYELLWALQSQCAIISTSIPTYADLLHDKNSIIINGVQEIVVQLQNLKNNKRKYEELTGYKTDLSLFKNNSVEKWNAVLNKYSGVYND